MQANFGGYRNADATRGSCDKRHATVDIGDAVSFRVR